MDYKIKIDMDDKSLLDILTHIVISKLGLVTLGQVYDGNDGYKLAVSEAEKYEEICFKTKIVEHK